MNTIPEAPNREVELKSLTSAVIARAQFLKQAGITFGGKRDTYEIFGYLRTLGPKDYRDRYARGGIAKRIVEALPNATWRGGVQLVESEDPKKKTKFEKDWIYLVEKHHIIPTLRRADILAGLSTYSVILIGAAGNLDQELPKGRGPDSLLYLTPFTGGGGPGVRQTVNMAGAEYVDATIKEYEQDVANPRFGLPTFYQLRRDSVSKSLQVPVHWSRIIHVVEGALDNEIFGPPTLEACWNLLDDLDKVTGGGAEAFFLRVNRGLQLDIDKDMTLSKDAKDELTANVEKYEHGILRMLRTRGVTVNDLGSDVANFTGPVDAIITQIAGTKSIPKRILTGSEMGEMASSQDRDNWKDQVDGRRTQHAGPGILQQLADRLIEYNYVTKPTSYNVRWPDEQQLTENERAEGALKWAQINNSQGTPVFLTEEIRDKWYQMDPLTPEQLQKVADEKAVTNPAPMMGPDTATSTNKPSNVPPQLAAAGDLELMRVLEEALASKNYEVIDEILGIDRKQVPEEELFDEVELVK